MRATVRYLDGHDRRVVQLADEPVVVGRVADCTISAKDDTVTRRHACIYPKDGRHWIKDLGSDNGTWINGKLIKAPQALMHLDKIQCGRFELEYFIDEG
jgi:pSer/pThr/pTyr-binding forkhead associated (FHA) protein